MAESTGTPEYFDDEELDEKAPAQPVIELPLMALGKSEVRNGPTLKVTEGTRMGLTRFPWESPRLRCS